MLWIILGTILLLVVFVLWPKPVRRYMLHAQLADKAMKERNWPLFDKHIALVGKLADGMKNPTVHAEAVGTCHLLTAESWYRRGDFDKSTEELKLAVENLEKTEAHARGFKITRVRHIWGDLHFDLGELNEAEQQFRGAVQSMEYAHDPAMAIFSLQRLCDVLIEKQDFEAAHDTAVRCVEYERNILSKTAKPGQSLITMSAPDLALASRDFPQAEKLFREKADYWSKMYPRPDNIDTTRYQFHQAEAQQAQGNFADACATLEKACETAAIDYGPDHPRVARAKRKLEQARALLVKA